MGKKKCEMVVFEGAARYYPSEALSLDELAYWIAFSRVLGIGPVRFKLLLDFFEADFLPLERTDLREDDFLELDFRPLDFLVAIPFPLD